MRYFNKTARSIIAILLTAITPMYVSGNPLNCSDKLLQTKPIPFKKQHNLNFTNWANYISPEIIPCFKKLFNVNVRLSYTTDDNMTRAKVMTGASGFDVIEQGALYLPGEIKSNALIPLDKTKLPNWKYRNKAIYEKVAAISDPLNRYGIVYSYGTTGIAYNQNTVNKILGNNVVPNSWQYLYNPYYLKKLSKCGVSLLDEPEQVFGNYFHYTGIDPNTTKKEDYEQAALYLIKNVRPYIKYFDSNKYQSDFSAGNLCIAMGYSGDMVRSVERAKTINPKAKLHYVLPKEGTNIWFDMLMIPKGATNIEAAYQFLNFIMDPTISALNSNFLYQPSGSHNNKKYLQPLFNDPNINPGSEMIKKMYVLQLHPPALQAFISEMWMHVKYGIEFSPKFYHNNQSINKTNVMLKRYYRNNTALH